MLFRSLSLFMKMPAVPKVGEQLRFKYACYLATRNGQVDPLRAVLRQAHNNVRGSDYSFFTVPLDQDDPLNEVVKGMTTSTTRVHLFAYPVSQRAALEDLDPTKELFHVEFATII